MVFERYAEKIHLESFDPIYLEQMGAVELMNRVDTKYVIKRAFLNKILPELAKEYSSLEVENTRMSGYTNQYFDTDRFKFFLDHHNGAGNRHKVRIRKYNESGIYFLEVKNKFKGRTKKKRIRIDDFEPELTDGSTNFVEAVMDEEINLEMKLWNSFDRITLVNKKEKERLTIDVNLSYKTAQTSKEFNHFVIAELKQERINRDSLFYKLMKNNGVRKNGFSKYCVGAVTVVPNLKYNNFKRHLRLIDKLEN
ncbi:MAG: polyphosphate polymerase domain-containing protein [Crocinitomicaceae bacterium]|nr:polyphosphate polymerase domain-containing protein [Crocinitomicaceae bacterium]